MAKRSIRARVRAGRLEPLESLPLLEGSEVTVTVDIPEAGGTEGKPPVQLHTWNLGVKTPVTREDIYDDVG